MKKHIFWIASYPKSGNTLIRSMLSSLFFTNDGKFNFNLLKYISQFEMRNRLDKIKDISRDNFSKLDKIEILSKYWHILQSKDFLNSTGDFEFMKTHSCLVSVNKNYFTTEEFTRGYIYIVRDPRDIAISWSKHANLTLDDSINFLTNFNSAIEWADSKSELPDQIIPKTILSSWNEHVKSWTENKFNVPKLIIRFEDLINSKKDILIQLIDFFDQNFNIKILNTEEKIKNIIKSTEFKNVKKEEEQKGFPESIKGRKFFRKGETNQWIKILNYKQIEKIEDKCRDFMIKNDYKFYNNK